MLFVDSFARSLKSTWNTLDHEGLIYPSEEQSEPTTMEGMCSTS